MDEDTCMVDLAKFFLEFTVDESCGKCPPCRIGTKRMLEILDKDHRRKRQRSKISTSWKYSLRILKACMRSAVSARRAPNPVLSTTEILQRRVCGSRSRRRNVLPASANPCSCSSSQQRLANAAASARRTALLARSPETRTHHSLSIRTSVSNVAFVWKDVRSRPYSRTRNGKEAA